MSGKQSAHRTEHEDELSWRRPPSHPIAPMTTPMRFNTVSRFTSCTRAPVAPLQASSAAGAVAATAAPPSRAGRPRIGANSTKYEMSPSSSVSLTPRTVMVVFVFQLSRVKRRSAGATITASLGSSTLTPNATTVPFGGGAESRATSETSVPASLVELGPSPLVTISWRPGGLAARASAMRVTRARCESYIGSPVLLPTRVSVTSHVRLY